MSPSPILVGVLYDFPQGDGGASFEEALRLGLSERALDREVELVPCQVAGLPGGTARAVEEGFASLEAAGVLAVVGPSISDNGLIVRDLCAAAGLPCVNYTGGERTRGEWMFHYQVGSLEEEPVLLARHLASRGVASVASVADRSPVGARYGECFAEAAAAAGLELVGQGVVPPLVEDASGVVGRLLAARPDALSYLGLGVAARAVSLAVGESAWDGVVVANSALMFGYARKDWRAGWEGWVYVDTVSDGNRERAALAERSRASAAGPVGVAAYDIGRLLVEGVARAPHLTRAGVKDGLEAVKLLPAASGLDGTTMGFGAWDRGALKGRYLVLRQWRAGRTVEVEASQPTFRQ